MYDPDNLLQRLGGLRPALQIVNSDFYVNFYYCCRQLEYYTCTNILLFFVDFCTFLVFSTENVSFCMVTVKWQH